MESGSCGIVFGHKRPLTLLAPAVMMENLKGMEALRRSTTCEEIVITSIAGRTNVFDTFVVPGLSFVINITAKAVANEASNVRIDKEGPSPQTECRRTGSGEQKETVDINIGNNRAARFIKPSKDMSSRLKDTVLETLLQVLLLPIQIIVTSFTAIIVALLYLKTRQPGGESLQDLLAKFEETDQPRKKWQERVRQRLIQSGRLTTTSKP
jgi:hypothetical protein